jgi:putative ATPase
MDLFDQTRKEPEQTDRPLADRMRPGTLDEFIGQQHLLAKDSLLRRAIEEDILFSMIFLSGRPGLTSRLSPPFSRA